MRSFYHRNGSAAMALASNVGIRLPQPLQDRNVQLSAIFPSAVIHVIKTIASLGYATHRDLIRAGLSERHILRYVLHRSETTNNWASKNGIPEIIVKTSSAPFVFFLNKEAAEVLGIEINRQINLKRVFMGPYYKLLQNLFTYRSSNSSELADACGFVKDSIPRVACRINERCKELGLPIAILISGSANSFRYELSEEFASATGMAKQNLPKLSQYFSPKLEQTMLFLALHPFSRASQVALHLGTTMKAAEQLITKINEILSTNSLPPLRRIGNSRSRYAASEGQIKLFGLKANQPKPRDILAGPRQIGIYEYFTAHLGHTVADAAAALGINNRAVTARLSAMNKLLVKNGFEPLRIPRKRTKYPNFLSLAKSIILFRKRFGYWPNSKYSLRLVRKIDDGLAYSIRIHGGPKAVLSRLIEILLKKDIRYGSGRVLVNELMQITLLYPGSSNLRTIFNETETKILLFLASHPFLASAFIAQKIKMKKARVAYNLRSIALKCQKNSLPGFCIIGGGSIVRSFVILPQFLQRFDIKGKDASKNPPEDFLPSAEYKRTYIMVKSLNGKKLKTAARRLGVSKSTLSSRIRLINRCLTVLGFPPLREMRKQVLPAEFPEIMAAFVSIRQAKGGWPGLSLSLLKTCSREVIKGVKANGEAGKVLARIVSEIPKEELIALIRKDLQIINSLDFSKYKDWEATVKRAFLNRLVYEGAELVRLKNIFDTVSDPKEAIAQTNKLATMFSIEQGSVIIRMGGFVSNLSDDFLPQGP